MKWFKIFVLAMTVVAVGASAYAKDAGADLKPLIDSQRYVFQAQWVSPMSGRPRALNETYTLTILKDSVVADLPYFGKADFAPANLTDAGIKFTSTRFNYTVVRKKRSWDISIKTSDTPDGNQLFLTVFDNGSAMLNISSNTKDGISYNGIVKADQ